MYLALFLSTGIKNLNTYFFYNLENMVLFNIGSTVLSMTLLL